MLTTPDTNTFATSKASTTNVTTNTDHQVVVVNKTTHTKKKLSATKTAPNTLSTPTPKMETPPQTKTEAQVIHLKNLCVKPNNSKKSIMNECATLNKITMAIINIGKTHLSSITTITTVRSKEGKILLTHRLRIGTPNKK